MYNSIKEIKRQIKDSEKIILNDDNILSYGSNRICYFDEANPSQLIKIARHPENWVKDHRQSFSEWYISTSLVTREKDCRISHCQGLSLIHI